ncbi:DUF3888 domain-containing protein [Clostridium estertheticum]|uniref:DUF3888 domain-containing protein n=1 Tax=Clostridium estertheticum TaxID=238834 RepID=UPI0013E96D98|nr:DUF3888 domain-containing protein [Clostridium estertheticum]MBZ9685332.1 DUF3888 domain-containing protein [Clostridium estertheticum]
MKRILLVILLVIGLVVGSNNNDVKASVLNNGASGFKTNKAVLTGPNCQDLINFDLYPKDQVMGWLIINFLSPYIQKPLYSYYGGFVPYELDTFTSQVLEVNYSKESSCFIVKLQIVPFLGAH